MIAFALIPIARRIGAKNLHFFSLSLGGLGLLTYAIFRKDPVIILGQLFGILIYLRNLILIYKSTKSTK